MQIQKVATNINYRDKYARKPIRRRDFTETQYNVIDNGYQSKRFNYKN